MMMDLQIEQRGTCGLALQEREASDAIHLSAVGPQRLFKLYLNTKP